jgi:hypothetical protein
VECRPVRKEKKQLGLFFGWFGLVWFSLFGLIGVYLGCLWLCVVAWFGSALDV